MGRLVVRVAGALLLAGFAWLNVEYWRDPVFWRRWWDTMTHMQPDYLNLGPLEVVAAGSAPALPVAGSGERSIAADALRAAEAYAARFDSFALIVVHRGRVQSEWYRADWSAARATQSQSMMKTLVALMLGAAIEDGYIRSLEDPVARYVPEWAGDARGAITLRNLLNMSSGLARYEFTVNPFSRSSAFRFLFSAQREPIVLATPLVWEPGSRFEYNDVNAQLAGMIVTRASGRRFAEYLSARLWQPTAGAPAQVWLDAPGGNAMTACCLLARAMDWARVGVMLEHRGRVGDSQVLPAAWIDELTKPSAHHPGYGLFTWIGAGIAGLPLIDPAYLQSEPFLGGDVFVLSGNGGQRVYVSRALELVVVRLGPFNGYRPLKEGWDNARLFNTVARGILRADGGGE
jgi:CubicO group peptidase (beta-lactamase class C family)